MSILKSKQLSGSLDVTSSYAITASYATNGDFWKINGTTDLTGNVFIRTDNSIQFNGIESEIINFNVFSNKVLFNVLENDFRIINLAITSDTSEYKPLAISNITGRLAPLVDWYTFPYTGNAVITGSLLVSGSSGGFGGITGSLQGTASYALTASYAMNAGTTIDTGSFVTTSSFNTFTSSFNTFTSSYNTGSFSGSFTGSLQGTASWAHSSSVAISSSYATTASFATNFTIANTLTLDETLTDFAKVASTIVGSNLLFQQATGSFTSAHGKYTVYKDANARAGEFVTVWNGTTTTYFDNATTDIGNTADITFQSAIVSSQIHTNTIAASSGWTVKMIVTYL